MTIRILLVEDSEDFARLVKKVLTSKATFEFDLTTATTLADSLNKIAEKDVDLVITDLGLPDSAGLNTLSAIRAADPSIPVVVLTGASEENTALEALKLGAQDYLVKDKLEGRVMVRSVLYALERGKTQALDAERLRLYQQRECLMAILTHDLKSPLVGTNRVLDMVINGKVCDLDPRLSPIMLELRNSSEDLLNMVNNLLELYRYDLGQDVLQFENVSLVEVASECASNMMSLATNRKVKLTSELPKYLSPVRADRDAIRHVILNLMHNAVKFTPESGEVTITGSANIDCVSVQIKDTGPGINAIEAEQLFTKMGRGRLNGYYTGGTGLGLYLCNKIVESHNGNLSCLSEVDNGAVFEVSLPRAITFS